MAKNLSKEILIREYGITDVIRDGSIVIVKKGDRSLKVTKDNKIAVTDYSKPYKNYSCGIRASRTQIPVYRVAYAWEKGHISANEIAVYDPKTNKIVAYPCSVFRRIVLNKWAKKQVKGEE